MPTLRELLADGRVHVVDGAMGTMLYDKGVFLNACFDELVVKAPDVVGEIHSAYADAGMEATPTLWLPPAILLRRDTYRVGRDS